MEEEERRPLLVSRGWVQTVALVLLSGFFVLGLLAYRTYRAEPPIPRRALAPDGRVVFTGAESARRLRRPTPAMRPSIWAR